MSFVLEEHVRPVLASAGLVVLAASLAACGSSSSGTPSQLGQAAASTTASSPAAASASPTVAAKITSCGTANLGLPNAQVALTNSGSTDATYQVAVGFFAHGKQVFDGKNLSDPVPAGQTKTFVVVGQPTGATPKSFTCKIESAGLAK